MDVEMGFGDASSSPSHVTNPPRSSSASASSRQSSVVHLGTNLYPSVVLDSEDSGTTPPSPQAPTVTASANLKPTSSAKPRSTKPKARSPSPSPPPAPPPAPLQTIRLEIKLGGPDNYAVDIADIARATGQRPPTPIRVISATTHSDSDDDDDQKGATSSKEDKAKSKKKKKKNPTFEHYDTSDPFIDDSELAIDERTYFAQTKQQGFYVSSGEVALLKDKTPKKPKSKNPLLSSVGVGGKKGLSMSAPVPGASKKPAANGAGSKEQPVPIASGSISEDENKPPGAGVYTVGDPRVGEKRKRYVTVIEGGKKRKVVDVHSFHPLVQAEVGKLQEAIAKESWDQKGKFPPSLKPLLSQLAIVAIKVDEYDEHFFNLMPTLFPYNKFTMSKLIKRTVFQEHTALLTERQDALLAELREQSKAGFPKAEEEWEKNVLAWARRQELAAAAAAAPTAGGATPTTAPPATDSTAPTRHPTEEMDVDPSPSVALAGEKDRDGKDHAQQPPGKKYRLTEPMKSIIWQLVLLSNEICRLENEKNTLEGSVIQLSEQGLRKVLYQKIVAAFPEGWLSSGQISRDVSAMKKRFEKEAMENDQEPEF